MNSSNQIPIFNIENYINLILKDEVQSIRFWRKSLVSLIDHFVNHTCFEAKDLDKKTTAKNHKTEAIYRW